MMKMKTKNKTFKQGDIICRREGLGNDLFRVDYCKNNLVYFHYIDEDKQQYYGEIYNYKLASKYKQLNLF